MSGGGSRFPRPSKWPLDTVDKRLCEHEAMSDERRLSPATIAVTAGRPSAPGAPLNQPIVLASNFRAGGEYTRTHGTDTWAALETAVGALEGGRAIAFASGMAAASAIVYALAPQGRRDPDVQLPRSAVVAVRVPTAGSRRTAAGRHHRHGVGCRGSGGCRPRLGGDADQSDARCRRPADDHGRQPAPPAPAMVVDSTFATPLLQRPLEHGATIVLHSGTKFIGGHSDLLIGLCVTADDAVYDRLVQARTFQGATPGALEAFLALRGLRTMPIRLAAMQRNATVLVERLRAHPGVADVRYPGQGAMVSFIVTGGAAAADALCEGLRILVPATSLGGVETTIERRQKYAGDAHVPPGLLRMSVGIEDVEDLWADIDAGLATVSG